MGIRDQGLIRDSGLRLNRGLGFGGFRIYGQGTGVGRSKGEEHNWGYLEAIKGFHVIQSRQ